MATVAQSIPELPADEPLIREGENYESITATVADVVLERPHPISWYLVALVSGGLLSVFGVAVLYLFAVGTGIWGLNQPVAWGFAIVNFVWWIGIGHAGTLISAILLLLRQDWRMAINRTAEAMTLFAVACAALFPFIHMGRPWVFFFIFPYPNTMGIWPNFLSPLVWDVFAISTYGTVSAIFWYIGLIPDLGTLRDRAKGVSKYVYAVFAMGWRGSAKHWLNYEMAYLLLGGLSTPLVVSVHSVVSLDFAVGIIPGWHTTIFPPYFVAGAIYSGFAMVLTIMIPLREMYKLHSVLTIRHFDYMAKVMLATGLIVAYGYSMEAFFAWYSGSIHERFMMSNRMGSPSYMALILCNIAIPQLLWLRAVRRNPKILWVITIVINIGMWLERYVIVVTSLARDLVPSSWGEYSGTIWDWATYVGSIGLFLTLTCIFIRILPAISMSELRHLHHKNKELDHRLRHHPRPSQHAGE